MENVHILIKQIGNLKEILNEGYANYLDAEEAASKLQSEIHSRGYTDFRVYVQSLKIIQ